MKNKNFTILTLLLFSFLISNAQQDGVIVAGGNGFGDSSNQLLYPSSIHVDVTGNIYIADIGNHRIQKWSPNATVGVTVAGGNGQGSALNQLNFPRGVYIDPQGNIYIADTGNNRVQKWTPNATDGITVAGGNGQGNAPSQLDVPFDLFVDSNNDLIIADSYNGRVQKWSNGAVEGSTIAGGNGKGGALNQLDFITSIFVTPNNDIYVTQNGGAPGIRKWTNNATEGENISSNLNINSTLGIFVDIDGNIFTGANNNVIKINPNHTQYEVLAGDGALDSFNVPYDVFISNSGQLYVSDFNNHRVWKFTPPFGCQMAHNVISNSVTPNSFNIEWTGTAGKSYKIKYKKLTDVDWTESSSLTCNQDGTMQYPLTYLESVTNYEFQIKTICNYVSSQYSNSYFQATLPLAPNITVLESQPSCLGAINHLEASNCSGIITWSNGATGSSISVSPNQTTSYSATCKVNNLTSDNSNEVTIDILKNKSIQINSSGGYCIQNFLFMDISLDATLFNINWFKDGQNIDNINSAMLKSQFMRQVAIESDLGTYYAKIEKKDGGCIANSDTLTVQFNEIELPIVKDTLIVRGTVFNAHAEGCSNQTKWYKFPVRVPGRSYDYVTDGVDINVGYVFSDTTLYVSCYKFCESGRVAYNIKVIEVSNAPNPPILSATYQNQCTLGPEATILASNCTGTVSFYKRDFFSTNQLENISIGSNSITIPYSNTIYASCEVNGIKSLLSAVLIKQKILTNPNVTLTPYELNSSTPLKVNMNSSFKVGVEVMVCSDEIKWHDTSNSALLNTGNVFEITNFTTDKSYYVTCSDKIYGCPIRKDFSFNIENTQPYIYPSKPRFPICGSGSTNLEAGGCLNGDINWYSSETSTATLGTGSVFVTPTFSSNSYPVQYHTYWVSCSKNGQEVRKLVNLLVAPTPNNAIVRDSTLNCNLGGAILQLSGCNGSYEYFQTNVGNIVYGNSLYHNDPLFTNATKVYQIKCTSFLAECSSPTTKEITVSYDCTLPPPPIIGASNTNNTVIESKSNASNTIYNACLGSEFNLVATGCSSGRVLWKDGDLVLNKTFLVNKEINNIYAYCINNANVLSQKSASVSIVVNPKPVIQLSSNLTMNVNNTFDLTNPTITSGSNFPFGTTISYFKNATLSIPLSNPQNLLSAGSYYLKATTPLGCFSSVQAVVLPNCNSVYSLISPNDDVSSGNFIKKSFSKIDMKNKVIGTARVESASTRHIILLPGFISTPTNSGMFKAEIGGCN